jgi:putative oxygen-independent coproporphyrinogen III oxidase
MLIYVHVPFCRSKCAYCGFFSHVPTRSDLDLFPGLIAQEAALWAERLDRPEIETVSLGGGTPSLLPAHSIESILSAISSTFPLRTDVECTMEANPESAVRPGYLEAVARAGVNRLSLGGQSMDDRELARLGRRHTRAQTLESFALARKAGFVNISLDLMFGLPGQTLKGWLETLTQAVALAPEHLSCYGLTVEPETLLERTCREGNLSLPDDEEQAAMFLDGALLLGDAGYEHYEISNYAREGMQCRHNAGYWQGLDYLGLGPGAVSTVNGRRWENPRSLLEHARRIREGALGADAELLDPETLDTERIMLSLRTAKGMDKEEYLALFPAGRQPSRSALLRELERERLITPSPSRLALTEKGMLLSNEVIAAMLPDR